jgi:hypothetical protein
MAILLGGLPNAAPVTTGTVDAKQNVDGRLTPMWVVWLSQLFNLVKALGGNGTTANRPTAGLYIGMDYFDQTLGYKVTVKSLNPPVWVNGAGGVV